MPDKAILTIGEQQIELPVIKGTEGEVAVDITKLRDKSGIVTYDPSLGNTAVCKSAITFIDGEKGHPALPRHSHRPVHRQAELRRSGMDADFRTFAETRRIDSVQRAVDRERAAPRGAETPIPAHSAQRPADGHSLGDVEQFGLLPSDAHCSRGRGLAGRSGRTPDQQGAHNRGVLLSPFAGLAVQLSRSASPLLRELPAHDVLVASPPVHGDPRGGGCAESDLHFTRRPRAELQHVDRACCRLGQSKPVCIMRRGRLRPVGDRCTAEPTSR